MAHGGRRRGAGRPKGAKGKVPLARAAVRAYFDAEAVKAFAPILAQYLRRAQGLPSDADPRLQIDFLNRLLGKPPESVEVSGAAGAAVSIRVVHQQLED